jgi:hypothetical protein
LYLIETKDDTTICSPKCPIGNYIDEEEGECIKCDDECAMCSGLGAENCEAPKRDYLIDQTLETPEYVH